MRTKLEGDKQIDAEEAEKEGEDISFNDFMERILEDEGSFLEHMSSLFEGYRNSHSHRLL